ncbi:alpha-L-rhamnosidase [Paenibacillus hemerocallicola]|uniref:Alpha-L-rhamnosidase n=1 Tax=Paenibacillus hemerocallicola TaxID=1172614 RepID=A0A5C4T8W4_9BACL|nr:family 78 glycoside hydrolase catalytic domain [Paenibacillus hemerocallicola]TNJ65533.1 alpha-L-rhamnosidase [Paenibacillus hemerocallicola]
MKPIDWQAQWIWNDLPENTPNVYLEARKVFELERVPETAMLHISANQEYIVYVNGTKAGRGPSPSDNAWKYFDSIEVGSLLRSGRNAIAILAYNFGTKEIVIEQAQGPGGIIAQLDLSFGSETQRVCTDDSWRCRRSPRWVTKVTRQHMWGGYREIYLADGEDGWEGVDYDDAGWPGAVAIAPAMSADSPWPRLLPREIPFLSRRFVSPVSIVRTEANYGTVDGAEYMLSEAGGRTESGQSTAMRIEAGTPGAMPAVVFDFGRVTVGYVEIELQAPEGGVIQLHYGESLDLAHYDTFMLKQGSNRLEPFGRRAFRYVKLVVQAASAPVAVSLFGVRFVHYDFAEMGTFECSDPLLNRIWDVGTYTTIVNSQDHLEDCPLREKALWIADAIVMGKVIYQTFGDSRLLRKCLLQGARIQLPEGAIPGTGPERNGKILPDFCAHWLFGVYEHWTYTRDEAFLAELWPSIVRLLDWFRAQEDEDGLFAKANRRPWWCFIDWAEYIDRRDRVTAVNCFYAKALGLAGELAEATDRAEQANDWRERGESLKAAIRQKLRLEGREEFADCLTDEGLSIQSTAQTNFSAIWSGVTEGEEADRYIRDQYEQGRTPELKGAFFYHIVLETLFSCGFDNRAIEKIRSYWGEMLSRGATTWWETFDPDSPHSTVPGPYMGNTPTYLRDDVPVSFCHGWGAAPTYLLTRYVLGIDVSELGDGVVHFRFRPGDVGSARGEVPTRYGTIKAEWSKGEDGAIRYRAIVPQGLQWIAHDGLDACAEIKQLP